MFRGKFIILREYTSEVNEQNHYCSFRVRSDDKEILRTILCQEI